MDRQLLPVGTRIRFTKTLTEPANEDHPDIVFAKAGDFGVITGHGTKEGYWAKWEHWPHAFGVSDGEFEIVPTSTRATKPLGSE